MMIRLLLAVVAAVLVTSPAPAHATDPHAVVSFPLEDRRDHPVTRVHVQAPRDVWGLRNFLKTVDLPGLRISMYGPCTRYPGAACVRVKVARWSVAAQEKLIGGQFWGLASIHRPDYRQLWLNRTTPADVRHAVAVHEFGHILGMDHHKDLGIVGRTPNVTKLSAAELAALREVY
jgi:hypothetical protein